MLRNFITVAEQGSISRAARLLHISQPPLSNQIHAMEDELETQLFERSAKGVRLTESGKILYDKGRTLLALTDDIVENIKGASRQTINIGIVSSAIDDTVELIKSFKSRHDARFQLIERDSIELMGLLDSRVIDAAFLRTPVSIPGRFTTIPIIRSKLIAVARRGLLEDSEAAVSIDELSRLPLITIRRWENFLSASLPESLLLHYDILCEDNRTSLALARRGLGVAIMPDTGRFPGAGSEITVRPITGISTDTDICLVYDGTRIFGRATGEMIDFVCRRAAYRPSGRPYIAKGEKTRRRTE